MHPVRSPCHMALVNRVSKPRRTLLLFFLYLFMLDCHEWESNMMEASQAPSLADHPHHSHHYAISIRASLSRHRGAAMASSTFGGRGGLTSWLPRMLFAGNNSAAGGSARPPATGPAGNASNSSSSATGVGGVASGGEGSGSGHSAHSAWQSYMHRLNRVQVWSGRNMKVMDMWT